MVNIYIRDGRINARIKSKEIITKFLSDISNSEDNSFLMSVKNVGLFIEKVKILLNNDFSNLNALFSHKAKNRNSKTDQNFYLLWMMLSGLMLQEVKNNTEKVFEIISEKFMIIQRVPEPENYNINEFINNLPISLPHPTYTQENE